MFITNYLDQIIQDILDQGYTTIPNFVSAIDVQTLRKEVEALWQEGEFNAAGIGRGSVQNHQPEIRGDFIHWLTPSSLSTTQAAYWRRIDHLRQQLNYTFFLNVQEFESHLAIYPAGAFYKRHLDQHRNTQRRQIACILYLNDKWHSANGGQLRIYPYMGRWNEFVDVEPVGGTLVCFRCDTIYHEVLPANCQRYSLTGWLSRRE